MARLRSRTGVSWAMTGLMGLLALVFVVGTVGPPILGQRTFVGVDLLWDHYPWQNLPDQPDSTASNWGPISDTVDGTTPARTIFAESVRDGDLRLWNPWIAGGTAHASTPISGVYNPLNAGFLLFPAHVAPAIAKLCELAAAIGFTFLFLRRVGVRRPPAILGGVAFAGSGFMVLWSNWPQPGTAALIPALFWAAERMIQLRTTRSVVPLAIAVGAIFLGGFPMVAVYGVTALGPFVLARVISERRTTGAGAAAVVGDLLRLTGALVLGVLLAAFALLPFQEDLGRTDLTYRGTNPGLAIDALLTAVAPAGLGGSWTDTPYFGATNQVEEVSYLGVATLLLVMVAVWWGRPRGLRRGVHAAMVVGLALTVAAIYIGDPVLAMLEQLPFYGTNAIGRARSLLGFLAAVVAAMGLDALLDRRGRSGPHDRSLRSGRRSVLVRGAVVLAGGGVVGLVVLDEALERASAAGHVSYLWSQLLVVGVIALVAAGALALVAHRSAAVRTLGVTAIGAALVFQSLSFAAPITPDAEAGAFYPEVADLDWLAEASEGHRVAPEGATLYPSANALYGVRSVTGHTFHQQTWKELLLAADPMAFAPSPTLSRLSNTPAVRSSPVLDRLAAKYFVMTPRSAIPGVRSTLFPAVGGTPIVLGADESTTRPLTDRLPPLRGLSVTIESTEIPPGGELAPMGRIEVLDGEGEVIAENQRRLDKRASDGSFLITLPTAAVSEGDARAVRFSVIGDAEVALAAAADGLPALWLLEALDDGLELVRAGDIVVFDREAAMPRIRWASETVVETDSLRRLKLLGGGIVPRHAVVLSGPGPGGSGAPAALSVARDDPEEIEIAVDAAGEGYVVVADALQQGWVAELDGERVELVEADHAGVGVSVPEGEHRLTLRYEPPGRRLGLTLTGIGWLVVVALLMVGPLRRPRRQTE